MHLIKQLCFKEEQKIDLNMTTTQINDWVIETKMSNLIIEKSQKTSNFIILYKN